MLLVTGRKEQKKGRIRREEERGPSQTQWLSVISGQILKYATLGGWGGEGKTNCNSCLLFPGKLLNHWNFHDRIVLQLPHGAQRDTEM